MNSALCLLNCTACRCMNQVFKEQSTQSGSLEHLLGASVTTGLVGPGGTLSCLFLGPGTHSCLCCAVGWGSLHAVALRSYKQLARRAWLPALTRPLLMTTRFGLRCAEVKEQFAHHALYVLFSLVCTGVLCTLSFFWMCCCVMRSLRWRVIASIAR